ncbi:mRNA-capping enzyme-like [Papaver somniferum]|uniref:mRNA-capping enzyme-like n=1 Tax=Papaver somniferum TaxID=3469 RepID=UPI000E70113A|nr:mRNA-capping enzyme-like [Papaver somniferum]
MDHHNYNNQINNSNYYPTPTPYPPPPRPTPSAPPEESVFPTLAHGGALASSPLVSGHHGHHGGHYPPTGCLIQNYAGAYPPPTAPVESEVEGIYSTLTHGGATGAFVSGHIHSHYGHYYPPTGCPTGNSGAPPAAYPPPNAPGASDDKGKCLTRDQHGGGSHEHCPPPPPRDYPRTKYPLHGDHGDRSSTDVCNRVLLTNDDVLGDAIPEQQQNFLRRWCNVLLKRCAGTNFPGSHPVSLDWENFQFLWQTDYRVTWKADGTRYLMLINSDGCYLIDRKFNFRGVQMRFPLTQENGRGTTHDLTLLDGEMVIDTDPETNEQKRKYLAFDLMAINGKSVTECPFGERWKMLDEQVIGPRKLESQSGTNTYRRRYDLEPFSVEIKNFWLLSDLNDLVKDFIPSLLHSEDGLIFQGWNDKYIPSTNQRLLKWKPREKNSVDFLLLVGIRITPSLYLYDSGRKRCMYRYGVKFRNGEDPSQFSGKVIECSCPEKNVWSFMRVRDDKEGTPNSYQTYEKVMKSINDNITEEVLLDGIQKIVQSTAFGSMGACIRK